jgi:hypothetical protein
VLLAATDGHSSVLVIVVLCVLAVIVLGLKFTKPWKRK